MSDKLEKNPFSIPLETRIPEIVSTLHAALPPIASTLIRLKQDMTDPANQSFATNPDDPNEHSPQWHQYGILRHSLEFGNVLQNQVPRYIDQWGLTQPVEQALSQKIDGVSKRALLQVAAIVHDLGKFTARTIEHDTPTTIITHFDDHEEHSGKIVRGEFDNNEVHQALQQYGFSDIQIEYIATCASLHFELGKIRRAATDVAGYAIAFTETTEFVTAAENIIREYPDYALEIGLEFMADNLSKTEVAATAETDEGIVGQRKKLEAEIARKGLNPQLINQALQQPVNMAVAKKYLQIWAEKTLR